MRPLTTDACGASLLLNPPFFSFFQGPRTIPFSLADGTNVPFCTLHHLTLRRTFSRPMLSRKRAHSRPQRDDGACCVVYAWTHPEISNRTLFKSLRTEIFSYRRTSEIDNSRQHVSTSFLQRFVTI